MKFFIFPFFQVFELSFKKFRAEPNDRLQPEHCPRPQPALELGGQLQRGGHKLSNRKDSSLF